MASTDANPSQTGDAGLVRRFFRYVKPYKKPLRTVYALHFLNSTLNLLPAMSLAVLVDLFVLGKEITLAGITIDLSGHLHSTSDRLLGLAVCGAGMVVLIVLANAIGVVMWRKGTAVTQRVLLDLKTHIVHHLHKLSMSYFHREQTGSIMTRAVGDVMQMQQMIMSSFHLTYSLLHLLFAPLLMLALSPLLFLACLLPLPVIVYIMRRTRRRLRPLYRQQREKQAKVDAAIQEQISGIREIKAFGQEQAAAEDVTRANEDYRRSVNDMMKVFSVNHQVLYGTKDFAKVLVVACGAVMILYDLGGVTPGKLLSFIVLMQMFYDPINRLMNFYDTIQRGLASAERVFEFFDIEPDVTDAHHARLAPLDRGRVEFRNVSFTYPASQRVLHDVSFTARPGQTIALIGSTGSGKSTIVSLLLRFYDPDAGQILVDGHDLQNVKMESLRNAVGIVFQETFLFYGTVRDNIAFSRPGATEDQIEQAARLARIHDFIAEQPNGYDTMVGERGVQLSGGQRQRLAIARMILKNPSMIILDEATSALDTTTEKLVQEGMDHLIEWRTAFIIAHRLSTIRHADRILVIEEGRIVEQGTHEQLLAGGGRYRELIEAVQ